MLLLIAHTYITVKKTRVTLTIFVVISVAPECYSVIIRSLRNAFKIVFLKFHSRASFQKSYLAALLALLPKLCNQAFSRNAN